MNIRRLSRVSSLPLLGLLLWTLVPISAAGQEPGSERAVFEAIEENRTAHLAFLQRLIQAQEEGEEAVQALVATRFSELGMEVEILRLRPIRLSPDLEFAAEESMDDTERISVVGRLDGAGTGKSLLFFAHPDGEPVTQASLASWEHDPFEGKVENGRIYGWGAADDLTGVAIMAEALAAVLETAGRPRGDILLASTPAKRSARGILGVLNEGYHADAAVYLHPAESEGGLEDIKAITSGMLQFRVTVGGRGPDTREPGQTAFAHKAVSALDKTTVVMEALDELDRQRGERVFHPALEAAVGRSTNLLKSHISCGREGRTTRVPTECVLEASLTFPPGEGMPEVRQEILDAIQTAAREDEWLKDHPPQIEWLFGTQGVEVSGDHPLYRTVHEAVVEVTGVEPRVNPLHSASDIKNPNLFSGIPSVGIGPLAGDLTQAGGHDEWVDVEDYIQAIKICAKVMIDWSG
ncbi:MAG: M20/M25/M40 family metallo-hydrolase [Longimicrobiales bacterium]